MITTKAKSPTETDDATLVGQALSGDRDAFGQIVARYQSLVCSLAYSATGSLSRSEDLAQETFVAGWRHLGELREPAKLRSWLCGIARNRIGKALREDGHEPSHAAQSLDLLAHAHAREPLPPDQTISREEEAILWRSLGRIPETYREPLVLFYREHQSIERVARQMDLSENAVKQRLSRGRKLLHEQVLAFVEGALEKTNPGQAFTLGVIAALPVFATTTTAATVGVAASKGSVMAKSAASVGLMGAILGPIIGILGGIMGTKASIENTESPRERQFMIRVAKWMWTLAISFSLAIFAFVWLGRAGWRTHPILVTATFVGSTLAYVITLMVLILWFNRTHRRIRREESARRPVGFSPRPVAASQTMEYRSRWTLLGLPLVHIQSVCQSGDKSVPAKGWIAIGRVAYGALFAAGGLAVAPISMGGFAVGLVAVGGGALGLLSFAGVALGVFAVGGAAVGYEACGGGAVAWLAAMGGAAVAHGFALGGAVFAQHANDEAAGVFLQHSLFLKYAMAAMKHAALVIWLPMLLVIWQALRMRKTAGTDRRN